MTAFLSMGGYGLYVWGSYAIAIIGFGGLVAVSLYHYFKVKNR